jgi:hypothetical protein
MYTISNMHRSHIRWPRALFFWGLAILILAALLLAIQIMLNGLGSPDEGSFQGDWVRVVQNHVIRVPAPLAPPVESRVVPLSTPTPPSAAVDEPVVIPVPIPTSPRG